MRNEIRLPRKRKDGYDIGTVDESGGESSRNEKRTIKEKSERK